MGSAHPPPPPPPHTPPHPTPPRDPHSHDACRQVILPSSFMGSPRNMAEAYHDAMAIVRDLAAPDLFITFTCNENWPEIRENLNLTKKHPIVLI